MLLYNSSLSTIHSSSFTKVYVHFVTCSLHTIQQLPTHSRSSYELGQLERIGLQYLMNRRGEIILPIVLNIDTLRYHAIFQWSDVMYSSCIRTLAPRKYIFYYCIKYSSWHFDRMTESTCTHYQCCGNCHKKVIDYNYHYFCFGSPNFKFNYQLHLTQQLQQKIDSNYTLLQ